MPEMALLGAAFKDVPWDVLKGNLLEKVKMELLRRTPF
jgi:hypothetical protein